MKGFLDNIRFVSEITVSWSNSLIGPENEGRDLRQKTDGQQDRQAHDDERGQDADTAERLDDKREAGK